MHEGLAPTVKLRHHHEPSHDHEVDQMAEFLSIARNYDGITAADGHPIPIILKSGERMLATLSGATLIEPRKGPGHWEGRSQGVSVHVPGTRSVRYRVGASTARSCRASNTPPWSTWAPSP